IGQAEGGAVGVGIGQGRAQLPEELTARRIGPVEGADADEPLDDLFAETGAHDEVADARVRAAGSFGLEHLAGALVDALDLAQAQPDGESGHARRGCARVARIGQGTRWSVAGCAPVARIGQGAGATWPL